MSHGSSGSRTSNAPHFPSPPSQHLAIAVDSAWTDFQVARRDVSALDAAPYLMGSARLEVEVIRGAIESRLLKNDPIAALQYAEEYLEHAKQSAEKGRSSLYEHAEAHILVGQCYKFIKSYDLGMEHFQAGLALLDKKSQMHSNARIEVLGDIVVCSYQTQGIAEAEELFKVLRTEYAALSVVKPEATQALSDTAANLGSFISMIARDARELSPEENSERTKLLEAAEQLLRLSLRYEDPESIVYGKVSLVLGSTLVALEREADAVDVWLHAASLAPVLTDSGSHLAWMLRVAAAEVLLDNPARIGEADDLLKGAAAALRRPKSIEDKALLIEVFRLQADLFLQVDDFDNAFELLEEARAIAAASDLLEEVELNVLSQLCDFARQHRPSHSQEAWIKRGVGLSSSLFGEQSSQHLLWKDRFLGWLGARGDYKAEAIELRRRIAAIEGPSAEKVTLLMDLANNYGQRKLYDQQDLMFSQAFQVARQLGYKQRQCMVGLLIDMADAERLKVEDAGGFEPSDPRLARSEKLYRFAVRHADRFIDEPLLKVGALTELGRFVAQYGNEAEAVYLLRLAASTTELAYGSNAMGPERADVSVALIGTLLRQMKGQEALQEWQIGNQCAETYPALLRECAEIFRIQRATIEVVRAIEVPNPRNVTRALSQVDTLLDADDDFTDLREEPLIQLLELARDLAESGTDPDRAERYSNLLEKLGVEPDEDDDEH